MSEAGDNVAASLVITKSAEDYGVSAHDTKVPVMRIIILFNSS